MSSTALVVCLSVSFSFKRVANAYSGVTKAAQHRRHEGSAMLALPTIASLQTICACRNGPLEAESPRRRVGSFESSWWSCQSLFFAHSPISTRQGRELKIAVRVSCGAGLCVCSSIGLLLVHQNISCLSLFDFLMTLVRSVNFLASNSD